ncbi:hypothetical protein ERJ75_001727200 [Trypanosoma vivax]|uniref:EF-hand domain-containing protein n=1 Tax=Trypanosoma vivax (strain Y486) TaxID=1055687 RepID=G0U3B8_TRYVY|nr:hypothetical protein TRVL_03509 [Trypanosoma vivax]KAH8604187.1 hypothetical protein ERJ75_001727200 [Trypanosoma vivax]CCC50774.1 conserved hypothetical protein [Trypanosoma vivax Y486]
MYRSHGELRSYAQRVFWLYSTDGLISVRRFAIAWYVLWGRRPDAYVIDLLFNDKQGELCARGESSGTSHGRPSVLDGEDSAYNELPRKHQRISEDEFVRFAVAYLDSMGADAAEFSSARGGGGKGSGLPLGLAHASQWAHFESLAGPKGYVTLEDLLVTERVDWLRHPVAVNATRKSNDVPVSEGSDEGGRAALLSHAFSIADKDGDGKIVFNDMEKYLRPYTK